MPHKPLDLALTALSGFILACVSINFLPAPKMWHAAECTARMCSAGDEAMAMAMAMASARVLYGISSFFACLNIKMRRLT